MACPVCGGTARSPIAPGYWRCITLVEKEELAGTAGAADPWLGPTIIRSMRECGHEYAEIGAGMHGSVCTCGTFAIGLCKECSRPICGTHSGMWEGVRLCGDHLRERQRGRDEQFRREQQALLAADGERWEREQRERDRAKEERAARLAEARHQIPGLLAQLRASGVPPQRLRGTRRGWRKRMEGWLLFEDPNEGNRGTYMVPYHVTTEGEFINDEVLPNLPVKNPSDRVKMIDGDYPYGWGGFDWIKIADRLRELISRGS
jgi:hypothetical protein